jgi:hypothetical protein
MCGLRDRLAKELKPTIMKISNLIRSGLLACLLALAAQPAFAGLHIRLVNMGGTPPEPSLMVGGGNLPDIMQVAAENWERVFKQGSGSWNVTIYYSWGEEIFGGDLYGRERLKSQRGGNVVRITESIVLFNAKPPQPPQGGGPGLLRRPDAAGQLQIFGL